MSEGLPRYSADGKWWWDGEQWRPVEQGIAPTPYNPLEPRSIRRWRRRVVLLGVAIFLVLAGVVLATAIRPGGVRIALPNPTATHRSPASSPSTRPSPALTAAQQEARRYRVVADGGGNQVKERSATVVKSCTAPANLAVCRSAMIALEGTEASAAGRLATMGVPACLTGPDAQQRAALAALDRAARQAVSGIDQPDPGQIVAGVTAVKQAEQDREAAQQQVDAAAC